MVKLNHIFFGSLFLIFLIQILIGCSSVRNQLSVNGGKNEAIQNAILDFTSTNKLFKKYSVFEVEAFDPLYKKKLTKTSENNYKWENEMPYENLIVVNIFGNDYKNRFKIDDIINKKSEIPSKYFIIKNKLFIWRDSNTPLNGKTIEILKKYEIISADKRDSMKIIEESKKGTDYYFCKKNLKKYKKVTTNIATGYYEIPKIECE